MNEWKHCFEQKSRQANQETVQQGCPHGVMRQQKSHTRANTPTNRNEQQRTIAHKRGRTLHGPQAILGIYATSFDVPRWRPSALDDARSHNIGFTATIAGRTCASKVFVKVSAGKSHEVDEEDEKVFNHGTSHLFQKAINNQK